MLRTVAHKAIGTNNRFLNYLGWGMSQNIPLNDFREFKVYAPNGKGIIYNFCPQDNWVLVRLYWSSKHLFEKDTVAIFFEKAAKARTVLDIGANLGYYTYLAAAAGPGVKVIAFEPIKYLADKVRKNSSINEFNLVTVLNQAVSDKKGIFPFYINTKSPTMSTLSPEVGPDKDLYEKVTVELIRIDDYIEENNVIGVDLIKIDVEEHEPEALEGMTKLLERDKPDLICEILPVDSPDKTEKRDKIVNILARHGYKSYWISPKGLVEEKEVVGHKVFNANYLFTAR